MDCFCKLLTLNCFYCNSLPKTVFSAKRKGNKPKLIYNGIDRVNPLKGYTEDNTVSCCPQCNYAKSDNSIEEYKSWLKRTYEYIFKV